MSQNFYLRSVHKRWTYAIETSQTKVVVCSPYLTPKTALTVLKAANPERCAIYSRFSLEDFASGASSLPVLASLIEDGFAVFEIAGLHAKIVLISEEFVSIGSQNMTARGTRNREATYCTEDASEIGKVAQLLTPWLDTATPITAEMVADAMQLLPPIEKAFRAARQAAADAEEAVRDAQNARAQAERAMWLAREAERQHQAALLAEQARKSRLMALVARDRIDRSLPEGKVPLELAQAFIRRATWWHSHSSGQIVSGAGHARRIKGMNGDWRVDLGANSFMVGRAISRCFSTLRKYINSLESDTPMKASDVVDLLRWNVNGAVAAYNGSEFHGYPLSGNDMMFGTTSIDIRYFVRELLDRLPQEFAGPLREINEIKVGV